MTQALQVHSMARGRGHIFWPETRSARFCYEDGAERQNMSAPKCRASGFEPRAVGGLANVVHWQLAVSLLRSAQPLGLALSECCLAAKFSEDPKTGQQCQRGALQHGAELMPEGFVAGWTPVTSHRHGKDARLQLVSGSVLGVQVPTVRVHRAASSGSCSLTPSATRLLILT